MRVYHRIADSRRAGVRWTGCRIGCWPDEPGVAERGAHATALDADCWLSCRSHTAIIAAIEPVSVENK